MNESLNNPLILHGRQKACSRFKVRRDTFAPPRSSSEVSKVFQGLNTSIFQICFLKGMHRIGNYALCIAIASFFFACASFQSDNEVTINSPAENYNAENSQDGDQNPQEAIQVSEERYTETFNQVSSVIEKLNSIILTKDFNDWYTLLSKEYRDFYNDPSELARLSQTRRMISAGIILKNINDYFYHVVVPSRADLRLDDLIFYSNSEVEAIMMVDGEQVLVYKLRLLDGNWKIVR